MLSTPPAFVLSQDQTLHQGTTRQTTHTGSPPGNPDKKPNPDTKPPTRHHNHPTQHEPDSHNTTNTAEGTMPDPITKTRPNTQTPTQTKHAVEFSRNGHTQARPHQKKATPGNPSNPQATRTTHPQPNTSHQAGNHPSIHPKTQNRHTRATPTTTTHHGRRSKGPHEARATPPFRQIGSVGTPGPGRSPSRDTASGGTGGVARVRRSGRGDCGEISRSVPDVQQPGSLSTATPSWRPPVRPRRTHACALAPAAGDQPCPGGCGRRGPPGRAGGRRRPSRDDIDRDRSS